MLDGAGERRRDSVKDGPACGDPRADAVVDETHRRRDWVQDAVIRVLENAGPMRAREVPMRPLRWLRETTRDTGLVGDRDEAATRVAVSAGVIFFFAGLVKFAFHSWELRHFRTFGLPWPSALEILAGVLETVGGVLLVMRLLIVPVALTLAATMIVAIAASGIGHGDVIPSLTLAPVLLLAMIFLLLRNAAIARR